MSENNIQKGIREIKKIEMTSEEKEKILHNLTLHVNYNKPVKTPYFKKISSYICFFNKKICYSIALILIIILGSGGISYASETSLPGDLFYPIKTKVIEPVKIAFAKNPEKKADIQTKLAEKRLREAESLSKQGRLSTTTASELNKKYKEHKEKVGKIKDQMERNADKKSAEAIEKKFEDRMKPHEEMIKRINDELNQKPIFQNLENSKDSQTNLDFLDKKLVRNR